MSENQCKSEQYPENAINFSEMNRVMRHRLRNLCAGVKMTVDRIAQVTSETHPQLTSRCDVVKGELDNLQLFTERMDLLFDKLPAFEQRSLFEVIAELRSEFSKKFAFCDLSFEGPQLNIGFQHGTWLLIALNELLDNAGEASILEGNAVSMSWTQSESFTFEIVNSGAVPEGIPLNPPQPFFTKKSRHDGIGLAIVYRICQALKGRFDVGQNDGGQTCVKLVIPQDTLVS